MAFIYKQYYGRLITHEIFTTDESDKDWKYDEKEHKYDRKTMNDIHKETKIENMKNTIDDIQLAKLKTELDTKLKTELNSVELEPVELIQPELEI